MPPPTQPAFAAFAFFIRPPRPRHARLPHLRPARRRYATDPHTTPPSSATSSTPPQPTRFSRLITRLPKFTHRHLHALRSAPATHITSFLLLHELTAILPLFGLAGIFHYTDWLPPWFVEMRGVKEGTRRFGNWMRRRGWISEEEAREAVREGEDAEEASAHVTKSKRVGKEEVEGSVHEKKSIASRAAATAWSSAKAVGSQVSSAEGRGKVWDRGDMGVRIVVELATAYALVKALIIPRVVFTVWATPWFARRLVEPVGRRTVGPVWRGVRRVFRRGKKGVDGKASAGGTNAVEGVKKS